MGTAMNTMSLPITASVSVALISISPLMQDTLLSYPDTVIPLSAMASAQGLPSLPNPMNPIFMCDI